MRIGRNLLFCCFSSLIFLACYCQIGSAAGDVKPGKPRGYKPVAVEKIEDINSLDTLISNYNEAWGKYNNKEDREVFRYIKPGSQLYDKALTYDNNNMDEYVWGSLLAINFANNGKKAYLNVFATVAKHTKNTHDASHLHFEKYYWTYEAELDNGIWQLTRRVPNPGVPNKLDSSPRRILINAKEYLTIYWVYYADPNDANKLYRTRITGEETEKILDDSVRIVDLTSEGGLVINNKSHNNEVWLFGQDNRSAKKAVIEFSENGWNYFTDYASIFRVNYSGTKLQRIYSRGDRFGTRTQITEIKNGWIYFFYFSPSDKKFHRVKTDGTVCEFLTDVKADWRDEDILWG